MLLAPLHPMGCASACVSPQKVSKPAVSVDVEEKVLGVEIASFLSFKSVGEQFDRQILGTAAGYGAVGWHRGYLNFAEKNIVLLYMVQEAANSF